MIAQSLEEQLFRWLRAAELTCDRAALLVSQDPKVYKIDILIQKICHLLCLSVFFVI